MTALRRPLMALAALLVIAVCGPACSVLWPRPEIQLEPEAKHACRLVVAPPVQAPLPPGQPEVIAFDGNAYARDLITRVRDAHWFQSVILLPPLEGAADVTVLDRARGLKADLLLELEFAQLSPEETRNGRWTANYVLWLVTWFPSLWVADFDYRLACTLAWRLRAATDGSVLAEDKAEFALVRSLNHFQRGGRYWGLFRVATDSEAWRKIGSLLGPDALAGLQGEFFKGFDGRLREAQTDEKIRGLLAPKAEAVVAQEGQAGAENAGTPSTPAATPDAASATSAASVAVPPPVPSAGRSLGGRRLGAGQ